MKRTGPSSQKVGKTCLILFWLCLLVVCFLCRDALTVDSIVNFVPARPTAAAAVLLVLFCIKGLSVFIYSGLLYAVTGVLFPFPAAMAVNLLGSVLMSSLPFLLGKKAGSDGLDRLIQRTPKLKLLKEFPSQNAVFFAFFTRIIHVLPSDPVSMYCGAAGMGYLPFLTGSLLGLLPMIVCFTVMGMNVQDISSPAFRISVCVMVVAAVLSAVLWKLWRKRHEKVE